MRSPSVASGSGPMSTGHGRDSLGGSCGVRSSSSSRRSDSSSCSACPSSTSASTPRMRRSCRRAFLPGRPTTARLDVRRGRVLADRARDQDGRPADHGLQHRRAVRLLATPRCGSTDQAGRGTRRRRPAAAPLPVPAPLRRPCPTRPVPPGGARRNDAGRPHCVHRLHAVRPESLRGTWTRQGPPGSGEPDRAARGHDRPRRRRCRRGGRRGRPDRRRLPADCGLHPRHVVPRPVRPPALRRPPGEGDRDEHPVDHRGLRRARLGLPGRQPVCCPRVPAARFRRDDPAGDPVLRPLRALDGLRGLPPLPDEGGVGPDGRQPRGRRNRTRTEWPDRHLGRVDRGRRGRFVRVRRHRPHQGTRSRRGARGGHRRDDRPGPARAGHHAPDRPLELVAARPARTAHRVATAPDRSRTQGALH